MRPRKKGEERAILRRLMRNVRLSQMRKNTLLSMHLLKTRIDFDVELKNEAIVDVRLCFSKKIDTIKSIS